MWLSKLLSKNTFAQQRSAKMSFEFEKFKTLKEFGYSFNEDGEMRKIDASTGKPSSEGFDFNVSKDVSFNQKHYEALGEVVTEEVYKLLEKEGLEKIYTPENVPIEEASFIFCTKRKLEKPKKLIVLIHGSGVVRAGQWSRSLIINHSLNSGTQIPYIEKSKKLDYEVLVTNTNHHYYLTKDGEEKQIKNDIFDVFQKYVIDSDPEGVAIVAHSYGGVITLDLAKKYPEFFRKKVFAVGLTDSVHSSTGLNSETKEILQNIGRNWITSNEIINTPISKYRRKEDDIPCFSAGHTKHEWTSSSCINVLFEFFEKKYEEFEQNLKSKKTKLDL